MPDIVSDTAPVDTSGAKITHYQLGDEVRHIREGLDDWAVPGLVSHGFTLITAAKAAKAEKEA